MGEYGIDESELMKEVVKNKLKRKIDLEKEKIFSKIYKTQSRVELEDFKKRLHELDQKYEDEVLKIEIDRKYEQNKDSKTFMEFNAIKINDNNFHDYKKNIIDVINKSKYNHELSQYMNRNEGDVFSTQSVNLLQKHLYLKLKKEAKLIDGVNVPIFLWNFIFEYQKETISWLLKLNNTKTGGILADEMGLGKTLQIITFLASLFISERISYCLIVCPTTIIDQWVLEWKKYFPFVRICVLHNTYTSDIQKLFKSLSNSFCVVFVTYVGYKTFQDQLSKIKFDYLILDEGHKIKNKDGELNKKFREFRCENRLVLTGTPIQNNLKELWAIFEFINPGILGTYLDFYDEYEDPINKGQYTNATQATIEKAYKRTILLRNIIDPFILRRLKSQVADQLPKKTDKIVFCRMTNCQESQYKSVLDSEHITKILLGKNSCMSGLFMLRRICNHPYLHQQNPEFLQNLICVSAKLINMEKMLIDWKKENRKVLIFTQMMDSMDIIKKFLDLKGYKYLTMSGKTSLSVRSDNISQFNNDQLIFIFLLTTRVGGLGLNLVGASRVVIYDPDWNPSTDSQAKERAWRYGQKLDVETYRFITMDTIEEKIYEKQIFKDLLSIKVLKNPNLHRLFEKEDINDIFSYYKKDKKERIEEFSFEEKTEDDILNMFESRVDIETVKRMKFLRSQKMLSDLEMIEFIFYREEHDI